MAGVFDGHGGKEASEMASQNFLDYFFLHVVFKAYKKALSSKGFNSDEARDFNSNLLRYLLKYFDYHRVYKD